MTLDLLENVPLAKYCTMRLGGSARYLVEVHSKAQLEKAIIWAKSKGIKALVIGLGSNTIFQDDGFDGLVCLNKILGINIISEDSKSVILEVGAGEVWDDFVEYSTKLNLSGIEALSLIPGTVGAAPVQNIGAYGQEVSRTVLSVSAYDSKAEKFVKLSAKDLAFGYRTSKLKTPLEKRHLYIYTVTFKLSKSFALERPFYDSLEDFFTKSNQHSPNPANIRKAVISIRSTKLPDPKHIANSGSFFINPTISKRQFLKLKYEYPDIKFWRVVGDRYKISGAWLISSANLQGFSMEGIKFHENQNLVVVNQSATSTKSLVKFRDTVVKAVKDKFGVVLEQEPELL